MKFDSEAQKKIYERIRPMMKEIFGEMISEKAEAPVFAIQVGSAYTVVAVQPWREDEAILAAWSWVVTGAEMTPDLMQFLLNANMGVMFGAFAVDEAGDIMFRNSIVGSTCDRAELKHLVMAVMATADEFDDQIVARWGGQRAVDRGK